jgi:hypothetical protein
VRVLLAFLLIIVVGSVWETRRNRPQRALPLLLLCTMVAVVLFNVHRLV